MSYKDCLFCKVVNSQLPSYKIWEDEQFIAILDICPNVKGQALVIPKKHLSSYPFDIDEEDYIEAMKASRKVGKIIEVALDVKRIAIVIEGMGVDHLHVKLYPLHGLEEKFKETWMEERIYFKKYQGYITTLMGPKADDLELKKLAQDIIKVIK